MIVIHANNAHTALREAVILMERIGVRQDSRNGPVLVSPYPVATVYEHPVQRVVFWPERDANPFFHLYESLWMLAGRNDLKPLLRYVKTFGRFSDDGQTLHGAYGERWWRGGQLRTIIERLKKDPRDRRCVLQIWDHYDDLGVDSKDIPCNLTVTFQMSQGHAPHELDMVVFNRSNDIVWGAYGANAVHFSMLQEYMARMIGVDVGRYTQVSVNWHAYLDTFDKVKCLSEKSYSNPYTSVTSVRTLPIDVSPNILDGVITQLLAEADGRYSVSGKKRYCWADMVRTVLEAHAIYSSRSAPERYQEALEHLSDPTFSAYPVDWIVAAQEWLRRRYTTWLAKQEG